MTKTLASLLVLCTLAPTHTALAANKKNISGSGCVEKAVENSCRVVIDSRTGELYSLMFPARTPKYGTAIRFSGTPHQGASVCMQGKPIRVSKWTKEEEIKCPPPVITFLAP